MNRYCSNQPGPRGLLTCWAYVLLFFPSLFFTRAWGDVETRQVIDPCICAELRMPSEVFSSSCRVGMRPGIDMVAVRYASGRNAANAPMESEIRAYSVTSSDVMGALGAGF